MLNLLVLSLQHRPEGLLTDLYFSYHLGSLLSFLLLREKLLLSSYVPTSYCLYG